MILVHPYPKVEANLLDLAFSSEIVQSNCFVYLQKTTSFTLLFSCFLALIKK